MGNEAAYCCAGILFLVIIALFALSMRTNNRTRRVCKLSKSASSQPNEFQVGGDYFKSDELSSDDDVDITTPKTGGGTGGGVFVVGVKRNCPCW